MKTLDNFPVIEKNVLLRVDLNIPVNNGIVTDKTRLYAIKSTVSDLCLKKNMAPLYPLKSLKRMTDGRIILFVSILIN